MGEPNLGSVQRLSMKLQFPQYLAMRLSRTAVDWVPEKRIADRGHVDPHLVGAPRLEPAFDKCRVTQNFQPSPVRDRPLASRAFDDRNLFAIGRGAGERRIDGAFSGL